VFIFYVLAAVLIGILIIVHEVGHFVAARACRVTVERFSIGFGKKLLSIKRGATEYVLSLIPLGGYVKMAGTEVSEHPTGESHGPGTFPGKPVGLRSLIVAAGPVANLVWAFLVYIGIIWIGGVPMFGDDPVVGFVDEGSPAAAAGVRVLDRVLSVEGAPVETWSDLRAGIASGTAEDGISLVVERQAEDEPVELLVNASPDSATGDVTIGVAAYIPPLIGNVMRGSPADLAGIREVTESPRSAAVPSGRGTSSRRSCPAVRTRSCRSSGSAKARPTRPTWLLRRRRRLLTPLRS